jgi:hypothetical protein
VYQRAPTLASIGLGPGGGWIDASTQSLPPLNAVVTSNVGGGHGDGGGGVSGSGMSFFAGGTGSGAAAAADQSLQSLRPLRPVMFDYQQPSQQPAQQQQQQPTSVAAMRRASTDSSRAALGALHSYRVDVSGVDAGVDDSTLHSYHSFF